MTTIEKAYSRKPKVWAIHCLRVNIKSLTAEVRFIRQEAKRAGREYRAGLHSHRIHRLREEARYAHLALGWIRGRTYKQLESAARQPVDCGRLAKKINNFYNSGDAGVSTIQQWIKE